MSTVIKIEFNHLPAYARKLLAEALASKGDASPVVTFVPAVSGLRVALRVLGFVIGLAYMVVGVRGMIEAASYSRMATPNTSFQIALGAFLLSDALLILARSLISRTWPFERGTYLLPWHVVEAKSSRLVLRPLQGLKSINLTHQHTNFIYQGTKVRLELESGEAASLNVYGQQEAVDAVSRLRTLQMRYVNAVQGKDFVNARRLDPLWPLHAKPEPAGDLDAPTVRRDVLLRYHWPLVLAIAGGAYYGSYWLLT